MSSLYTSSTKVRLIRDTSIANACFGFATEEVERWPDGPDAPAVAMPSLVLVEGPLNGSAGDVVEVDKGFARWLIDKRYAEWIEPPRPKAEKCEDIPAVNEGFADFIVGEYSSVQPPKRPAKPVRVPKDGLCHTTVYAQDGGSAPCGYKFGHKDQHRTREQIDARLEAQRARRQAVKDELRRGDLKYRRLDLQFRCSPGFRQAT